MPADTTILGSATLTLFVSTEDTDTDFMAVLHDVRPDGAVQYLQRGFLRASHRGGDSDERSAAWSRQKHQRSDPLVPGEVYKIEIPIFPVGHVLRRGHRLEVGVLAPNSVPDPHWALAIIMQPGVNTVHHSAEFASQLRVPVIPGLSAQASAPECGSLQNQPCRRPKSGTRQADN